MLMFIFESELCFYAVTDLLNAKEQKTGRLDKGR